MTARDWQLLLPATAPGAARRKEDSRAPPGQPKEHHDQPHLDDDNDDDDDEEDDDDDNNNNNIDPDEHDDSSNKPHPLAHLPVHKPPPARRPLKAVRTAAYLENLTLTIFNLSSARALHHPVFLRHMAPSVFHTTDHADSAAAAPASLPALIAVWQAMLDSMPEYRLEMLDARAELSKSGRRAKSWYWRVDRKWENLFSKEVAGVLFWERRKKVWVVVRHASMTHVLGF